MRERLIQPSTEPPMKKMCALLLAAALPAAVLPAAATAAAEIEPLTLEPNSKLLCNAQTDWCVGVDKNGPFVSSRTFRKDRHLWDLPDVPNDFSKFKVWPQIIRTSEERAIVGVIGTEETPYSGGGFTRKDLYLFEVRLDGQLEGSNSIFELPVEAEGSYRACFNEQDEKKRAGHCSDQSLYKADVKVVPGDKPYPDLQVTTQASRFPVGSSRSKDSSTRPALTPDQLKHEADKTCSYTVTYQWQADTATYEADKKLPDCAEFTDAVPR